ncbi:hypothetical protein TUM17574_04510 [Klebsiella pneumoniae]|nr:hypothetical protein TUM16656_44550 [Klebsiella pneumoniae]GJK26584.1 hypothetical protein TUM17555_42590 [Klebsiella pneumoniae]GJK80698.1 hypothetical protein TUM17566_27500 [Klebsiella pneumoniae]GJL22075.1 hypothetical protein TUM17574_04510 [Klebsiella pneumoniae]
MIFPLIRALHVMKNKAYSKASIDTDQTGALNDHPDSNPQPEIINIFKNAW